MQKKWVDVKSPLIPHEPLLRYLLHAIISACMGSILSVRWPPYEHVSSSRAFYTCPNADTCYVLHKDVVTWLEQDRRTHLVLPTWIKSRNSPIGSQAPSHLELPRRPASTNQMKAWRFSTIIITRMVITVASTGFLHMCQVLHWVLLCMIWFTLQHNPAEWYNYSLPFDKWDSDKGALCEMPHSEPHSK